MSEVTHIVSVDHRNKGTSILNDLHNLLNTYHSGAQHVKQMPPDYGERP